VKGLQTHVDIHLDNTVGDGLGDLGLGGTGSTVEDEEERLLVTVLELLGHVGLVLAKDLGLELDVSGLVDTVDVSESGGDGEVGGDGRESGEDVVDVGGLSVERGVVDRRVVDSILLTTGDTDLHLEPLYVRDIANGNSAVLYCSSVRRGRRW
jgi:hypothetical protein